MKSKLAFSPDVIKFIHNRSRQFIESSHSDEMVFFEDIWEIYEEHLEKWINKPPRKWKFRTSKLKIPNFLSVSGGPDTLDLITPKILEVISLSYAQIIALKEHSLERIQEVISKCVKKLPRDIREETVSYLTPLIQKDSMKVLNIPEEEVKKEIEMDSRLKPKKDEIPPKVVEEKKEYKIYSHEYPFLEYPEGKKLSRKEFSEEKEKIKNEFGEYIIIIDEISKRIVIDGNSKYKITHKQKMFLKLLIKKADFPVEYKIIIRAISKVGKKKNYQYDKLDNYIAHRCFTSLHKKTKNKVENYIENVEGVGYKLNTEENPKYCLIEPLE